MGQKNHKIVTYKPCQHTGNNCHSGFDLILKLRAAIAVTEGFVTDDFDLSGTASPTGCKRACTLAYRCTQKAAYMFGDIEPEANIDELITFANHYATSEDKQYSVANNLGILRLGGLSKLPAAMIVVENCELLSS